MQRITITIILLLCLVFQGCNERHDYREALSRAESVMDTNPDSALNILDSLNEYSSDFDRHFNMQYQLQLTNARMKSGVLFTTDSLTLSLVDYFDSNEVGKPTGADMAEGKLTLPVIYALQHSPYMSMTPLAQKVKTGTINADEIAVLVEFAKEYGGIDYARTKMDEIAIKVQDYIEHHVNDPQLKDAFYAYLEYAIQRKL